MDATRRFSETHQTLTELFDRNGWPIEPFYLAPVETLAAMLTIHRLPDEMSAIWRGGAGEQSIGELMLQQLSSCRVLCANPGLSPEDRARELAKLDSIAVDLLTPRLRALQNASSHWKQRVLLSVRLATLLAGMLMVGAVLYTRFRIVAPLLIELDDANASLANKNADLESKIARRTHALSQALKDATVAHEARTRFFAGISHEMRTPLNGVLGVANLLRNTDLTPEQLELVDTIAHSGHKLVGHIDGVLEYVSIGAGRLVLQTRPVSVPAHLAAVLDQLRPEAEDKGLTLHAEGLNCDHVLVQVDADRLSQIASNLVGSAIKLTETGDVMLRYSQKSADGGVLVKIDVIDTGCGLSEDVKDRLFLPFEREDVGVPTESTGLSLAIAKSLVSQMGGALKVHSAPGAGTKISVQLTLPEGDNAVAAEAA